MLAHDAMIHNWLIQDPDPETRQELEQLLKQAKMGNQEAQMVLDQRFSGRLQFGTGGIRGVLQAGPMGMNRVLVAQVASGLANYLKIFDSEPSIVIAYDGRKNSAIFAQDTAEIMAGVGIRTIVLPRPLPTPVLAFAIRYLQTSAGVMVTASHNPPQDNGYKVYLGKAYGGSQITSPVDQEIAKQIEYAVQQDSRQFPRSQNYEIADENVIQRYIQQTAQLATQPIAALNYVYTPLHGVGKETLIDTLKVAGLPLPHIVTEQAEPDPHFPTVSFPNPEEKGALDLAIKLAKQHKAELIIANDPDADRFAVALPNADGEWHALHGNMIGCLLAWHIAQQAKKSHQIGTLACSLVSTPALKKIAQTYDLPYQETLTGFKYIAKVPNLLFGFEESLGYLVDSEKVGDKDGISAAIAFLDLINELKSQGKTLNDYITEFEEKFGYYASSQISIRITSQAETQKLMLAFRHYPPQQIGIYSVIQIQDYLTYEEPSDILVYTLSDHHRMIIRPSGTEPKIKIYLDVAGDNSADANEKLAQFEQEIRQFLHANIDHSV